MRAADPACVQAAQDRSPKAIPPGWRNPVPRGRYDLLVVGAGPAGLVAARTAAAAGAKVALVEGRQIGGNCIHEGCIPSKTLIRSASLYADMRDAAEFGVQAPTDIAVDFGAAMARVQRIRVRLGRTISPAVLTAEGIDLHFGYARFVGPDAVEVAGSTLRFKKALIATGSRPVWPQIDGLAEAGFLNNETVFDLQALPPSLLVIGGGPLGCELAQAFARFGARTLISHSAPLFLPKEERDAAQMVSDGLARDGVEIHLNCQILSVRAEGGRKRVQMQVEGDVSETVVDAILTGIGRRPAVQGMDLDRAGVAYDAKVGIQVNDFLRTTNPRIFAAGDVCMDLPFTNTAEAAARIVVRNALFLGRQRASALLIPWCTYTDPQVAHVGLYVQQARERNIPVKTFTVPMHAVDRAIADSEEDGFVKIHVREGTDRILGATIVGRYAGEMVNTVSMAMVTGMGLRQLAQVVHAYPTQGEAIRQAASACADTLASPLRAWLQRKWLGR
ncbi:MAG: mercuric reductase [Rhodoferax sp.]|uniref:mercuric reductase n=2 Tax=Rhodoferax sp. TaxID=50421 RepID=UPI0032652741